MMNMNIHRAPRARGFTITEMIVTAFLMALLAVLLGNAWLGFGRPAIAAVARCRVVQEANLAAEALARDVGLLAQTIPAGASPDSRYQNITIQYDAADNLILNLLIDDATGPPRTINYTLDPDDPTRLIRADPSRPAGATSRVVAAMLANPGGFAAARVSAAEIGQGGATVTGVEITLTFSHRTIARGPSGEYLSAYQRQFSIFVPDPRS